MTDELLVEQYEYINSLQEEEIFINHKLEENGEIRKQIIISDQFRTDADMAGA